MFCALLDYTETIEHVICTCTQSTAYTVGWEQGYQSRPCNHRSGMLPSMVKVFTLLYMNCWSILVFCSHPVSFQVITVCYVHLPINANLIGRDHRSMHKLQFPLHYFLRMQYIIHAVRTCTVWRCSKCSSTLTYCIFDYFICISVCIWCPVVFQRK